MISADVKANKNNKEIKDLVAVSYKLLEVPSKLEIQYKKGMYFSFDFGQCLIQYCLLRWLVGLKLIQLEQQKAHFTLIILAKNLKPILCGVIKGT